MIQNTTALKHFTIYDRVSARIAYLDGKSVLTPAERKELEAGDKMFRVRNYFKRKARAKKRFNEMKDKLLFNFHEKLEQAVFPLIGFDSQRTDAHRGTFYIADFDTLVNWLTERLKSIDFLSDAPRSITIDTKDGVRIFDLNLNKVSDSPRKITIGIDKASDFGDSTCKFNIHRSTHFEENWSVGCK